jgi:hypothetical protein
LKKQTLYSQYNARFNLSLFKSFMDSRCSCASIDLDVAVPVDRASQIQIHHLLCQTRLPVSW